MNWVKWVSLADIIYLNIPLVCSGPTDDFEMCFMLIWFPFGSTMEEPHSHFFWAVSLQCHNTHARTHTHTPCKNNNLKKCIFRQKRIFNNNHKSISQQWCKLAFCVVEKTHYHRLWEENIYQKWPHSHLNLPFFLCSIRVRIQNNGYSV